MQLWRVSLRNLARRKSRNGFTLLAIILGVASAFAVISLVENTKGTVAQFYRTALGNYMYALDTFYSILYIVGFLGIFISTFILYNSLYMSVLERKREFAVMKTIGYTPGQIIAMIMREVTLLAGAGTLIGAGLGYILAIQLQELMYALLHIKKPPAIEFVYPAFVSIAVGFIISIAAGLIPAVYACSVSVVHSLRKQTEDQAERQKWMIFSGSGCLLIGFLFIKHYAAFIPIFIGVAFLFPQFMKMWKPILERILRMMLGFEGLIAVRNAFRKLNRIAMTAAILSFGIALILVVSYYKTSFESGVNQLAKQSVGGDFSVPLRNAREDVQFIREHSDIEAVQLMKSVRSNWADKQDTPPFQLHTAASGWPTFVATDRTFEQVLQQLSQPGTVALGQGLFKTWGGQIGDKVVLLTPTGRHELEVVAEVSTLRAIGSVAFVSDEYEEAILGTSSSVEVLVRAAEGADFDALLRSVREHYQNRIRQIYEAGQLIREMDKMTKEPIAMIQALFMLAVSITGLGMINTLLMNVMERTREIGMMRSVASTRLQIVKMVLGESLVIGLAGATGGILMGAAISWLSALLGKDVAMVKLQFIVPWGAIWGSVVYGLLLSMLAGMLPTFHALKVRLTEAVRYD